MRETAKAAAAFADWLAMDPTERSLVALANRYAMMSKPPTRQLQRLKVWSSQHHWATRAAEEQRRERSRLESFKQSEREKELSTGLATCIERVRRLKAQGEEESRLLMGTLAKLQADPDCLKPQLDRRFDTLSKSFSRTLDALAQETGGRVQRIDVRHDLVTYARQQAQTLGVDERVAVEVAEQILRESHA